MEPRAVSIDDESLRTLQSAGLVNNVIRRVVQGYGTWYYSWSGKQFAKIVPTLKEYGYHKRNAFRQQILVEQLRDGLGRFNDCTIWFEHSLESFSESDNQLTLELTSKGSKRTINCNWLVACDGGRSEVREKLNIKLGGSTYNAKWLIVDLIDRIHPLRHTKTFCNPWRPAVRLPGPEGTLRYEFMLHKNEVGVVDTDEAFARNCIRKFEPLDADLKIVRQVAYGFHARVAEKWRVGRVFLAGDAAHLTPPFAGQGMNSGVRDATNLAWKLAAVYHNHLPETLLDSYEEERLPHAWDLIKMAIQIGRFMQPSSLMDAILTQTTLKILCFAKPAREYILQLKFKPKPRFKAGFFQLHTYTRAYMPPGQLFPQPSIEMPGGERVLLDFVLGNGFSILKLRTAKKLDVTSLSNLGDFEIKEIQVITAQEDFMLVDTHDPVVRDYEQIIEKILLGAKAKAVVLRPDRYIYGYIA